MAAVGVLVAATAQIMIAASAASGAGAPVEGRRMEVSVRGGSLDARIQGVALSEALAAVGRATQARVTVLHADTAGLVSLRGEGLTVEEGLQRLLRGQSYVLVYRDDAPSGRLAEIIVLGNRRAPADEAVTVSGAAETTVVTTSGHEAPRGDHPPEATRTSEIQRAERVVPRAEAAPAGQPDRPRPQGGGAVTLALVHADEHLRLAALAQIQDGTEAAPMRTLARMAREDASASIRIQALEILAEQSAGLARGPLRHALRDPHPEVQARAFELLDRLGPEPKPAVGAPAAPATPRYVGAQIPQQGP